MQSPPDPTAAISANAAESDVLVEHDLVVQESIQRHWTSLQDLLDAAAGSREPLGELLVLSGRLTRFQLALALKRQRHGTERLGEVLIRLGWITAQESEAVLAFQRDQEGCEGPLRLGNLLVAMGIITHEQLADALTHQRAGSQKLGVVLVERGYADAAQVDRGLSLQRRLLQAALAALISFCAMSAVSVAHADSKSRGMSVSVTVLPVVKLEVQQQPAQLNISAADVKRGYVEVPAGSIVVVQSNSRNGLLISFNTLAALFKSMQVSGLNSQVELGAEGGSVTHRMAIRQPMTLHLSYRFVLADDVQPGEYPWPVMLSAQAL